MSDQDISWGQRIGYSAAGAFGMLFIMLLCFAMIPKLSTALVENACTDKNCDNDSSIAIANQMGRLDVISLALGMTGLGVGAFAIFGFFAIKDHTEAVASHVAQKTAEKIAYEKAEETANQRLDWLKEASLSNLASSENDTTFENLTTDSEEYEDDK